MEGIHSIWKNRFLNALQIGSNGNSIQLALQLIRQFPPLCKQLQADIRYAFILYFAINYNIIHCNSI
jgi:hypothetical protein